jgi:hypothetical protein
MNNTFKRIYDALWKSWAKNHNENYEKYVAILNQVAPATIVGGLLVVGMRYTITNYVTNDDFSNVAKVESGTINTTGCVFIATGTTPLHYVHGSTLTSDGAPYAIIHENTLDAIPVFSYIGAGHYHMTLTGKFLAEDTVISPAILATVVYSRASNDVINIATGGVDGVLSNTPLEIKVYY